MVTPPDISVARDIYRGQKEGRSVGETVIRAYLPKPVEEETLLSTVRVLLQQDQASQVC